MKRLSGVLAGFALAGTMGIGVATSASAAPTSDVTVASAERAACVYRYVVRGTQVKCGTAAAGTQYRAWVKCARPNGSTYAMVGPWRYQGSGMWSTAKCYYGDRRINTPKVGELR
ncbi:MAG: hypothetical protein IPH03_04770 [Tetrasphaera sp.]|jgi:hypothetical protein|nr:hypothetical protein [Tetrasphaera sp.]